MESMDYEIYLEKDEDYSETVKKPYEKNTLEGGTRKPTRLELIRYKKNKKKNL